MDNLYLKRLRLANFKSYREVDLEFSPRLNCFVGNNGAGKTNLLDAMYYLSFCKSYFTGQDFDHVFHGEEFFTIQGAYELGGRDESLLCISRRDQKKVFKRNDKVYPRLADHIGLIPLVMVSPSDSGLITDGSEERRKYINSVISQYNREYLDDVIQYNKALQQRNKLLKDFSRGSKVDLSSLEVWDQMLAGPGQRIFEARKDFIERLHPIFQHYYSFISEETEVVGLVYRSQLENGPMDQLLKNSVKRDLALQFSTVGIHRDELVMELKGYPLRQQGSQGQHKSFLVALKLAQFDFLQEISGMPPLILLDDIFDKFDDRRVLRLIELVSGHKFGQIFITDKNPHNLEAILREIPVKSNVFRIEDGYARLQNGSLAS